MIIYRHSYCSISGFQSGLSAWMHDLNNMIFQPNVFETTKTSIKDLLETDLHETLFNELYHGTVLMKPH